MRGGGCRCGVAVGSDDEVSMIYKIGRKLLQVYLWAMLAACYILLWVVIIGFAIQGHWYTLLFAPMAIVLAAMVLDDLR
jgi:hypothetical protein